MENRVVDLDAETDATAHEGCFIHDAWKTSEALLSLGDKEKMWKAIEGVCVGGDALLLLGQ